MEPTPRHHFLDALRVIAIAVLLFYHTGMLFVGWGWHITNATTIPALRLPMDIAHRLRMPLLFVIAGAGLWFAAQRRSGVQLLAERAQRLLLPVVAGMLLVVPPQVFVERISHGQWKGGYLDFYVQRVLRFEPYPAGDFSWHHLWFIVYLFVYVLLLLPFVRGWRPARALRPGAWLYLLALPLGINEALLKPHFPETHALVGDWYTFNHYFSFTAYGVGIASLRGAWDWFAAWRRVSLAAAVVLLGAGLVLFEHGIIARDTPADALFANVFTWVWLMVFLGYGRQYLNNESRWLVWAREASYPTYILHQTLIIGIGYFVVSTAWSPWLKYWLVLGATAVSCVLLYEGVLRRFALSRLLFGIKTRDTPAAARGARVFDTNSVVSVGVQEASAPPLSPRAGRP
ncbi:MAG TPA: acyltransferase family protein [Polyangiaceae bacterium]|nr:acyltransferase family protein [Polyangiaceae bacterium]